MNGRRAATCWAGAPLALSGARRSLEALEPQLRIAEGHDVAVKELLARDRLRGVVDERAAVRVEIRHDEDPLAVLRDTLEDRVLGRHELAREHEVAIGVRADDDLALEDRERRAFVLPV